MRVEHDRVDATEHEIAVRMHVILVCDGDDTVASLRVGEQVVRERRAQRRDAVSPEIAERPEPVLVRRSNGQHFAELVVWNRDREARAASRAVFDAAQADVEVTARRSRIDAREANLDEARRSPRADASSCATSTSNPTTRERIVRIRLDVRRATFGITAPSQLRRGLRTGCGGTQRKAHEYDQTLEGHRRRGTGYRAAIHFWRLRRPAPFELVERARPVILQEPG